MQKAVLVMEDWTAHSLRHGRRPRRRRLRGLSAGPGFDCAHCSTTCGSCYRRRLLTGQRHANNGNSPL